MEENKKSRSKKEKKPSLLADIPLGLSSALSRDLSAMQVFAQMPDEKRKEFISGAQEITNKEDMRSYVAGLKNLS